MSAIPPVTKPVDDAGNPSQEVEDITPDLGDREARDRGSFQLLILHGDCGDLCKYS